MRRLKIVTCLTALAIQCISLFAEGIPSKPTPERLVNDFANIIDENFEQQIEEMLVNYNDTTSTQICVVTLPSLNGYSASEMAYEIGQKWGVGQKGKDNGVVFLVTPKTQLENGHAFIASGYGLEGALPDAICTKIINDGVIPYFRENDYNGGIVAGVTFIMKYCSGEFKPDPDDDDAFAGIAATIVGIIFIIALCSIADKSGKGRGGFRGGYTGGSFSGGSFGGGYSSGGFGGFGGGSFGGGGGGGSW
ncbi:MAG: TPM domain-containing protein [Bacteroidales bacterium]|nr:TPM domain-containing protein [Bacteroidales bacterium]